MYGVTHLTTGLKLNVLDMVSTIVTTKPDRSTWANVARKRVVLSKMYVKRPKISGKVKVTENIYSIISL